MKTYTFSGVFDEPRLHQEILAAYPGWITHNGTLYVDLVSMIYNGTTMILQLPDDAVDAVINAIVDAHDPAAHIPLTPDDILAARRAYMALPDWSTWTPTQGKDYIVANVFSGNNTTQANTYIDNTIVAITTANITQINAQLANIRTVLKTAAAAIISLRDMMSVCVQGILYLRDIVIKYRV